MTDDNGKESNNKKQRANEGATVADTPDSDPRNDAEGDGSGSSDDNEED